MGQGRHDNDICSPAAIGRHHPACAPEAALAEGAPLPDASDHGGGIRGVFPAAVLAELEHRFLGGGSIANHFDMIAGTSNGGIIALALAHGMTAR